jgi:NAD(P)-dependent dehydrogenase (short-subunit alcohol dehydrogenase family)
MGVCVVTGANRGIGLELARQLASRGERVIAVCRHTSPELESAGAVIVDGIDVTKPDDLQALAGRLEGETVSLLVNNAGVLSSQRLGAIDNDAIAAMEHQYRVNSLGPLLVTQALRPLLAAGSKVGIVTSRMGSIADNTSGGTYGYRMSKAAVNAAGMSLARDLEDEGIAVILLHPGYVRTDMTGGSGQTEPADAAAGLIARLDELDLASSGSFRHANGEHLPW